MVLAKAFQQNGIKIKKEGESDKLVIYVLEIKNDTSKNDKKFCRV